MVIDIFSGTGLRFYLDRKRKIAERMELPAVSIFLSMIDEIIA
jgi:hypothetical protein